MSMVEIIPPDVRVRGFKAIAFAAALYLGLRLAGVHRFIADDAEPARLELVDVPQIAATAMFFEP